MFEGDELTFTHQDKRLRVTFKNEEQAYFHMCAVNAGTGQLSESHIIKRAILAVGARCLYKAGDQDIFAVGGYEMRVEVLENIGEESANA